MEILGVDIPLVWTLLIGCVGLIYLYGKIRNQMIKVPGFPGPEPAIYFGNLLQFMSKGIDLENNENPHLKYGPVYAMYLGGIPMINVSDADIIKQVLVKDFDIFPDRLDMTLDDYPFNLGVLNRTGDAWKRLRSIISPTFSGSKLRKMIPGLNVCAQKLTANLIEAAEKDETIDIKQYFGAFTMDAIATSAFGINIDSQSDFDNTFIKETRKAMDSGFLQNPLLLIGFLFPGLKPIMKKLGFSILPKSLKAFFTQSMEEIIKTRRQEPKDIREKRSDFLELMLRAVEDGTSNREDAETIQSKQMTPDEIAGQGFEFFMAGYETTSTSLHYTAYALATHPDVQKKLFEEIDSVIGDDEPSYDNIHACAYLDRVITESNRRYTLPPAVNRRVAKTTTIKGWTFPEGVHINIPVLSIHMDPQQYPEPLKFKPERWETISKADSMYYLPFSQGPRHCVGMRLALVEMKIALVQILKKVMFVPAPETPERLTKFKMTSLLQPLTPIKLKVKRR